eukprot:3142656-Rhodomonas_salina.1
MALTELATPLPGSAQRLLLATTPRAGLGTLIPELEFRVELWRLNFRLSTSGFEFSLLGSRKGLDIEPAIDGEINCNKALSWYKVH